ncbi:MAG: PD40 domain-containing protein [Proteobacteria bacterium]|nr:PD40 domain-containing protein [Pseudomonadota bacterium]
MNIWKYEIDRGTFSPLTFTLLAQHPLWSPSGDRVVFSTPTGIGSVLSTGIGELENLEVNRPFGSLSYELPLTFSPDGAQLFYAIQSGTSSSGVSDIHSLDLTTEGSKSAALTSEFFEGGARISPDGRWFAYHTNETGRFEIFVRPFPALESGKYPVSSGGGQDPQWAADTGELFYRGRADKNDTIETDGVTIADDGRFIASDWQAQWHKRRSRRTVWTCTNSPIFRG